MEHSPQSVESRSLRDLSPLSPFKRIQEPEEISAEKQRAASAMKLASLKGQHELRLSSLRSSQTDATCDEVAAASDQVGHIRGVPHEHEMGHFDDSLAQAEPTSVRSSKQLSQSYSSEAESAIAAVSTMASLGPVAMSLANLIYRSQMESAAAANQQASMLQHPSEHQVSTPLIPLPWPSLVHAAAEILPPYSLPPKRPFPFATHHRSEPDLAKLQVDDRSSHPENFELGFDNTTQAPLRCIESQWLGTHEPQQFLGVSNRADAASRLGFNRTDEASKRPLWETGASHDSQLNSILEEGEMLARQASIQRCVMCQATTTPVWRRVGAAVVCNACGLREKRSAAASAMPNKRVCYGLTPEPLIQLPLAAAGADTGYRATWRRLEYET